MSEDAARRLRLAPAAAAGVDEAMIHRVVHGFYGKVREDPVLGPIFDAAIADQWDAHFARWLNLFQQTAQRICPPPASALFCAKAEMIAQSLQLGLAAQGGGPPCRRFPGA